MAEAQEKELDSQITAVDHETAAIDRELAAARSELEDLRMKVENNKNEYSDAEVLRLFTLVAQKKRAKEVSDSMEASIILLYDF